MRKTKKKTEFYGLLGPNLLMMITRYHVTTGVDANMFDCSRIVRRSPQRLVGVLASVPVQPRRGVLQTARTHL